MQTEATAKSRLAALCKAFAVDTSAATAIEYALIASGISIAIAATVWALGPKVSALFTSIETQL